MIDTTRIIATLMCVAVAFCSQLCHASDRDRVLLVSTRELPYDACRAPLDVVPFKIWDITCGQRRAIDLVEYQSVLSPTRQSVIYVHGNRMPADQVVQRASKVRCAIRSYGRDQPVDWVIFSWPSEQVVIGLRDIREKADRCDAEGLYLASLLRLHLATGSPTTMIGYSFGARVITGSLHALAGGCLGGRRLPGQHLVGANLKVGLVAPAIESGWLARDGYHRLATKNMDRLLLLYNRRDILLKRYWLIEKVRRETALGFSGPTRFAPRFDGSKLPVQSRDCSPSVRLRHVELDYYRRGCNAGRDMAGLIAAPYRKSHVH